MQLSDRDRTIIQKMQDYCTQIEEAHSSFGREYGAFQTNSVYRNAVSLCLMQIGELSIHLSEAFKDEHSEIPWKQIRGMRNVVAHEYGHIDTAIVWETATEDILVISAFCRSILNS